MTIHTSTHMAIHMCIDMQGLGSNPGLLDILSILFDVGMSWMILMSGAVHITQNGREPRLLLGLLLPRLLLGLLLLVC